MDNQTHSQSASLSLGYLSITTQGTTVITYHMLTYDTVITYTMKYKKKNDLHGTFIITCVPDYSCFLLGCFSILH